MMRRANLAPFVGLLTRVRNSVGGVPSLTAASFSCGPDAPGAHRRGRIDKSNTTSTTQTAPRPYPGETAVARKHWLDTSNRWREAVVRSIRSILDGAAPHVPRCTYDHCDSRPAARMAFDDCMKRYEEVVRETASSASWLPANCWTELEEDRKRVPIACNAGISGSGKTTQLALLCQDFVAPPKSGIAVYFTLNGDTSRAQTCDERDMSDDRLARRILHGLVNHRQRLPNFISQLLEIEQQQTGEQRRSWRFREWLFDSIPQIIRGVYGVDDSTPILIAADELRKWGDEPAVGRSSPAAVDILGGLASISQRAAARKAKAMLERSQSVPGSVYIAASTLSVFDPSKAITIGSGRPVYYMPLPPLNPCIFDAFLPNTTSGTDPRVRTILRATLIIQRSADAVSVLARRSSWLKSFASAGLAA